MMELNSFNYGWPLLLLALISFFMTLFVKQYSVYQNFLDVPNQRSSHTTPTPSGGGIAIAITVIGGFFYLYVAGDIEVYYLLALVVAGGAIAVLGFLDDFGEVSIKIRLLTHIVVAVFSLIIMGGLPPIILLNTEINLGIIGHLFALFYVVWLLNLYNFMDGIDGIAAVEAISVCVAISVIYCFLGFSSEAVVPLILAAGVLGFTFLNFPIAKIFMGDSGSGFLGVTLALVSLHSLSLLPHLIWVWLILLGVFVVDATCTLIRRFLNKEKVHQAHCTHAYQQAAKKYSSHKIVVLSTFFINVVWLFPLALLVALEILDGVLGVMVSYTPLVLLALFFNAGKSTN